MVFQTSQQGTRQRATRVRVSLAFHRDVCGLFGASVTPGASHSLKDRCLQCLGLQATDKGKTELECLGHAQGLRLNMGSCGCRGRKEIQSMHLRTVGLCIPEGP